MLSIHELGYLTRALPPMRRASRQPGAVRVVGARIVPRSVVMARSAAVPTRSRVLVEYTAALLYAAPFYGACGLAMARAALRRRQLRAARGRGDGPAGRMDGGHGDGSVPG